MLKSSSFPVIRLRGVRHNNLKNFDLDLPLQRLIVITGLSGSGKSSLAFDTLFAEGQRRYIETFSPYARQFFDRMDKPQVDSIEGIPPAIAIEQRNSVRTTRSTVGTMTEICDHMKVLWPHMASLHCRRCGRVVRKDTPQLVWSAMRKQGNRRGAAESTGGEARNGGGEVLITFDVPLTDKLSLAESLGLVLKQGYQRLLFGGGIVRVEEVVEKRAENRCLASLTIVQDRLKLGEGNRARFVEACEQAYHFGKGELSVHPMEGFLLGGKLEARDARRFSNRLHCAACDIEYREPSPALFSFNHPLGACPTCRGFGRTISIDYDLAIPDRSLTLAQGAVKPWRTGFSAECQGDLTKFCRAREVPMDVPFADLTEEQQRWILEGDPDHGKDEEHEWPRSWYGVKGYFRWLESRAYKMHVRVLLSRYRAYTTCPDCGGARFQPEALLYRLPIYDSRSNVEGVGGAVEQGNPVATRSSQFDARLHITLGEFYALPVSESLRIIESLMKRRRASGTQRSDDPINLALGEVHARLRYLNEVGLGYLTLDRPTRSLSGGETERVNLATCLGTRLVNTLFVLDEPSVGLHPRDTERLVRIVKQLRDAGNTVVVVEHEASVMRAADRIVDLGPGHGAAGGQVVFQGNYGEILKSDASLTGQYLSGRKRVEVPARRPGGGPALKLSGATCHNLRDFSASIPLERFVCVTGVSGSGKSTLIRDVLLPALQSQFTHAGSELRSESAVGDYRAGRLSGHERLGGVVLVDQSILGKTPRSNPAVYIGAFDDIREVFAQSQPARQRGYNASAFSFNSGQGQCERCRGAGFEKIEMQFLSDVFIRCPDCNGRRYRRHILEVQVEGRGGAWSIADMLDATVDEAVEFLMGLMGSRGARRAVERLRQLQEVGLGYLRLGQPINTLSGGESQRLKLVRHLVEATGEIPDANSAPEEGQPVGAGASGRPTLFLFDEPTTGLHFDDVRVLLKVFQRLVDSGHSVVVIEHNLDVIKSADWVLDLGPEGGVGGGRLVAAGTPEEVARCVESHTGKFLREILGRAPASPAGGSLPANGERRPRARARRQTRIESQPCGT